MKKFTWGDAITLIIVAFFIITFGVIAQRSFRLNQEREELRVEIQKLNREIVEYQAMEDFYWEFTNLLDEIYDGKIKEAVLIERVYWLKQVAELQEGINKTEYYELYIRQIQDDMDALLTITIRYYETANQEVTLEEYIATNYPELYERLLGY